MCADETQLFSGVRERKRRETLLRIAETGLGLFNKNGYEQTTLESIAESAGISARTFFYYFKTKDEILHFWQSGEFLTALGPALLQESVGQRPIDAVRSCLLKLTARYETDKSVIVDRILNSTEGLRIKKQAIFLQMEQVVFDALCQLWPAARSRASLRTVSMVSIGAMRLAMEARREHAGDRPLTDFLRERFAVLERNVYRPTKQQSD